MALSILDGNQSATTLSTILSSGQHITAHTVVSLGTQAITDMRGAVSGSVVSISNFPATQPVSIASVTVGNTVTIAGTVTANPTGTQTIAGTVTANVPFASTTATFPSQLVALGFQDALNTGNIVPVTNDAEAGLPAFVKNISVDGNPNTVFPTWLEGINPPRDVPISGTVTVGNSVTIASLPAISGTVTANLSSGDQSNPLSTYIIEGDNDTRIGNSNPLPISGTVTANTFALQGTAVTTSNFTSTTASTVLANYNATREVLTIFNEGAGNLHICVGATCTTIAYQVRLSSGDYYEVPNHQTTITHSAVFATAGTARVCQVS